jgi:sarcosine oxidase subunit beta
VQNAEVVIIGGGIQGLSLAYHLAQRGLTDVCLVEAETLGSGSSGKSAAVIGLALQSDDCLPLTHASLAALLRFEDELDASPDYVPTGCLILARSHSASWLRQRHARLQAMGIECSPIAISEVDRLTPGLNLTGLETGLYLPQEGVLDPHCMMMAYAARARQQGIRILEGVRATGLVIEPDRVKGVTTTEGTIACDWVVNAAGNHAREVAAWAGLDLPLTLIKRHIVVTGPVAAYADPIPFTYEMDPTWYMRREGPGLLLGMGSAEIESVDENVDTDAIERLIETSVDRAPALEQAGLMTCWAGLRPVTPDDNPILGPVPHLPGYINDCGWGGHGVMHAPAAGKALAEWIAEGESTTIDLAAYHADRFGQDQA